MPESRRRGVNLVSCPPSDSGYMLGKPFVYVAMTGLKLDLRFDPHKVGVQPIRLLRARGLGPLSHL